MSTVTTIYRSWISDDRPCDHLGPIETQRSFAQRADAMKWLADWTKEDVEGNEDLDEQVATRLLSLHANGRYDELISEYPSHVKVKWDERPLRLEVRKAEMTEAFMDLETVDKLLGLHGKDLRNVKLHIGYLDPNWPVYRWNPVKTIELIDDGAGLVFCDFHEKDASNDEDYDRYPSPSSQFTDDYQAGDHTGILLELLGDEGWAWLKEHKPSLHAALANRLEAMKCCQWNIA